MSSTVGSSSTTSTVEIAISPCFYCPVADAAVTRFLNRPVRMCRANTVEGALAFANRKGARRAAAPSVGLVLLTKKEEDHEASLDTHGVDRRACRRARRCAGCTRGRLEWR